VRLHSLRLHGRRHVGVQIERERCLGMPKNVTDDLRVNAMAEQEPGAEWRRWWSRIHGRPAPSRAADRTLAGPESAASAAHPSDG
jgi:hypothetical protein